MTVTMNAKSARARSTEFKHHSGLVTKLTMRYWGRAAGAKLPSITYEDVRGEMLVAFVKAAQGYDPATGYTFGAFYGRCAQNHMNKWLGRESLKQFGKELPDEQSNGGIGLCFEADLGDDDFESDSSLSERFADDSADPAHRVDAMRRLANVISDRSLLPETRAYIAMVANPSTATPQLMERIRARADDVTEEIRRVWGITINRASL